MNVMKKRTLALMLSAALCVGLLAGCGSGNNDPVNTPAAGGSETPSQESTAALSGTVNTNGSTSMESVMGYLTEGFKEVQPGITVNYTGSGSSAGVTGAQDGTCDIGLASRDLKDDETGVKAITVAKDGIAIIVNPNNPVADLSVEQIAQLATGEITNWADVGGTDGQVVFMGREAGSGTRDGFESITGTKDACKYQNELTSTGEVIAAVASNPNAIGYASLSAVDETVKAITVGGVEPTEETVLDLSSGSPPRARGGIRHDYTITKGRLFAMKQKLRPLEVFMNLLFFVCGLIAVVFVLFISIYLIVSGLPAIREIGLVDFLFGTEWASTAAEPKFGILPFILTSIYGTAGAIVLGVPVGFMTAVFLAKVAPPRLASLVRPAVDLLAGIPSVVYGLIGMMVLVPAVRVAFHLPDGASLFCAILVLAVMILPSIISVSETALKAVPKEYEEASLALGATHIETVFRVSVPAASSGIAASIVLGIGRAIGEAMAVIMVAGNVANMPGLFQSVRFLTTAVSSEMAYASGLQRQALFSIALVLFLFIMLINIVLNTLLKRKKG